MRRILPFLLSFFAVAAFGQTKLILTGIYDGPLSGGHPKGVELFAIGDISDLSIYGFGSANNGGGSDGVEYTFPAMAIDSGTFLYVCADSAGFHDFFGKAADFAVDRPASINGDDAVEIFMNGNVVDVYGDINKNGDGEPWDYTDGWGYRANTTGPDGSDFVVSNWTYSGLGGLSGESSNATASNPFPIGTYSPTGVTVLKANDDVLMSSVNMSATGDVLANDNLPNGFTAFQLLMRGNNGMTSDDSQGFISYVPNIDFCGKDTVSYYVCDNTMCDTAYVFITIDCPIIYEAKTIGEVTMVDADGNPTADKDFVELTGVVHSVNFRPGGLQFALIDSNNDGITVFSSSDDLGYTVTEGEGLTVKGQIGSYRGSLQVYTDSVKVNSTGNALFDPTIVTALNEDTESQLVKIENVTIVDPTDWSNSSSGFNVDVTDGTNTYAVRITNATNIFGTTAPAGAFNLTGIGGQFDFNEPYTDNYQLYPRYIEDIDPLSATNMPEWMEDVEVYPNPVSDVLNITGLDKVERITLFNAVGQLVTIVKNPDMRSSFSISHLSDGVYFLRLEKGGQHQVIPIEKN